MKKTRNGFINNLRYLCLAGVIALGLVTVVATGGGGGGGDGGGGPEASGVIGPEGGEVEVTDPNSPIYGARIVIPERALTEDTVITLDEGVIVDDPDLMGPPISCGPDGISFDEAVEIIIPLEQPCPSDDLLASMVYNGQSSKYEFGGQLIQVYSGETEVVFNTDHFSSWSLKSLKSIILELSSVINLMDTLWSVKQAYDSEDCAELQTLKDYLNDRQSEYWNTMQDFVDAHEWCKTIPWCNLESFYETARNGLIETILVEGVKTFLLAGTAAAGTLAMVGAISTAISIALVGTCDICFIVTSWANPDFLNAWFGHYVVEYGLYHADWALYEMCQQQAYPDTVIDTISGIYVPACIAITPDGSYAYVTNFGTPQTVSVIRTTDNIKIQTIPVGFFPHGIAVTPNGSYVYVANSDGPVLVIRTSDNTVIQTIPVGFSSRGIAVTPNGSYAYVANYGDDTVSVIRTSDNTVIQTIPVDDGPYHVAVTPDGSYVYVTNEREYTVSVIRTSDNTVIQTIPMGPHPQGVAVTPDGSYVYVTDWGGGTVSVIRTSDNTVIQTIPVGVNPYDVAVTPDGSYVYVTDWGGDTVSVIRTSDNAVIQTIPVGFSSRGVAVAPDGSYVYVANYYDDTVSVIGY